MKCGVGMRLNVRKIIASLAAAAMIALAGCGTGNNDNSENTIADSDAYKEYAADVYAMDTFMTIKAYGSNGQVAIDCAKEEIQRLEKLFNVNDTDSDISKINNSKGSSVDVSEDTANLIRMSLEKSQETDGALDISVYSVLKEWGFTTEDYIIPDDNKLRELLENVGYEKISVEGDTVTVPDGYEIDLGSVAKGYTSDRICDIMRENGISSALINLGGNVQTVGKKTNGELWKVAVENPEDTSSYICTINVENKAVVTSGNYERFFEGEDGNLYWHIIDPADGHPADNGIISATVIGESGVTCDALSTALFVMGKDKAFDYCKTHTEIEAVLVDDNMNIYITDGLSDVLEMADGYNCTVIKR